MSTTPVQKTLYLLRHGEPEGGDGRFRGQTNDLLTPLGWQQMYQAVASLSITSVISSPLNRCAQFAQALALERQIPCTIEPNLIEMGMGDWEGQRKQVVLPTAIDRWRYANDPTQCLPANAESFEHIQQRVQRILRQWQQYPDDQLLIVAHAGIIRFILAALLHMPATAALRIKLPFAACLHLQVYWEKNCVTGLWYPYAT